MKKSWLYSPWWRDAVGACVAVIGCNCFAGGYECVKMMLDVFVSAW